MSKVTHRAHHVCGLSDLVVDAYALGMILEATGGPRSLRVQTARQPTRQNAAS